MDILLKPLLSKIKSYVKADFDFLKKCKRNLTKNSKLVSFDVTSLYTNIPHVLGLKAIEYWLDEYPKLVLKNSHFAFNEEFFHQIAGFAMGTIVAPKYAALVMGYLELQFYEKCKNEFGVNNGKYTAENWYRFLDNCYIALDATNTNPLKLFDILNNINDNIKFTMEQQNLYLPFLDIMIKKDPENNNIWMDIFCKKTDTQSVFHLTLAIPNNAKRMYLSHLLEEFVPYWKTTKLKKTFGRTSESFIFTGISTKFNSGSDSKSNKYPHSH